MAESIQGKRGRGPAENPAGAKNKKPPAGKMPNYVAAFWAALKPLSAHDRIRITTGLVRGLARLQQQGQALKASHSYDASREPVHWMAVERLSTLLSVLTYKENCDLTVLVGKMLAGEVREESINRLNFHPDRFAAASEPKRGRLPLIRSLADSAPRMPRELLERNYIHLCCNLPTAVLKKVAESWAQKHDQWAAEGYPTPDNDDDQGDMR